MKKLKKTIRKISNFVQDILYPPRCSGCGEVIEKGALCPNCKRSVVLIPSPVCHKCATAMKDHDATQCQAISAEVVAAYYYEGTVKKMVLELKDNRRADEVFAQIFPDLCKRVAEEYAAVDFDMTVCVPNYEKEKYTSSHFIAARLADAFMLDFDPDILTKYRQTQKQHNLDQHKRMTNLQNSICVTEEKRECVLEKTILLCDDVKSTGTTLDECAKALYAAGAKKVCCVCIAVSEYIKDFSF